MEYKGVVRSAVFNATDLLEYLPKSIIIKSILKKPTGHISAASFDSGEILIGNKSPFETFIQIIEGKSEIIIDDISNFLEEGQFIIIPAHTHNVLKANVRFKMIFTTIKSGYEEMGLGI